MSNPVREHFKAQIGKSVAETPPGFSAWLKPEVMAVEENALQVRFEVRAEMCNPAGTLHGGMHASMLDEVIGMTVAAMGNDTHFVSLNMTTDFLRAAKAGDKVTVTSEVVKVGKKAIHIIANMVNADGKQLSRCTQNMVSTGMPMTLG